MSTQPSYLIRTVTGQYVDLSKPSPDAVRLGDMSHALGNINRFTGHTKTNISVLEHVLNVHMRVCTLTSDSMVRYAALMHDAQECYVCDVATPLKRLIGEAYTRVEDGWQRAVFEWAHIPIALADHPLVHRADREMLLVEAREHHGATEEELRKYWPPGDILSVKLPIRYAGEAIREFEDLVTMYRALPKS